MSIRIENRRGAFVADINIRLPDGQSHRERRNTPAKSEKMAFRWARRREAHLMMYGLRALGIGEGEAPTSLSSSRPVGWIYFLRGAGESIKIGWTSDLAKRIRTLQIGSPDTLSVVTAVRGSQDDEKALHRRFHADRIRGEWFAGSAALLCEIDAIIRSGAGVEQVSPKS